MRVGPDHGDRVEKPATADNRRTAGDQSHDRAKAEVDVITHSLYRRCRFSPPGFRKRAGPGDTGRVEFGADGAVPRGNPAPDGVVVQALLCRNDQARRSSAPASVSSVAPEKWCATPRIGMDRSRLDRRYGWRSFGRFARLGEAGARAKAPWQRHVPPGRMRR